MTSSFLDHDVIDDMDVAVVGLNVAFLDEYDLAAGEVEADDVPGPGDVDLLVVHRLELEPVGQVLHGESGRHDVVVDQLGKLRVVLEVGLLVFGLHLAEGFLVRSEDGVHLALCWKGSKSLLAGSGFGENIIAILASQRCR